MKKNTMKNYIKINKYCTITINKKYKLNYKYNELIAELEKYYFQKKRFKFLPKSDSFIIQRKIGLLKKHITDRWDVRLNFKYLQKENHLELLQVSNIANLLVILFTLIPFIIFIFANTGFKIEVFSFFLIGWIFVMSINIITKYNACIQVIEEFEKIINDNFIL